MMKVFVAIITNKCNMQCGFCLREKNINHISVDIFKKAVNQAKIIGFNRIAFTGGEPALHPEFEILVKHVVENDLCFSIVSNGFNIQPYIKINEIYPKNFERICFSLDSANKNLHDQLRTSGSFDKVIESIQYFAMKKPTAINMCLNPLNYMGLEAIVNLAAKLNCAEARIANTIPTTQNTNFILSTSQRIHCLNIINKLKNIYRIPISTTSAVYSEDCNNLYLNEIAINPNGEIKFCCDFPGDDGVIGSISNGNLFDALSFGTHICEELRSICKRTQTNMACTVCIEYFNTILKNYVPKNKLIDISHPKYN